MSAAARALVALAVSSGVLAVPEAAAQVTPSFGLRPANALAVRCGPGASEGAPDPWAVAVSRMIALHPPAEAPDALRAALDSLASEIATAPEPDPAVIRYREAMLLGARIETMEGRTRVEAAKELHARVGELLLLDPEHAGAHHLLGRLSAAVMRLGGAKRLLARVVVGGDLLASASWAAARARLEHAERRAPCMAEHHLELARLLADTGDVEEAGREALHVLSLVAGEDRFFQSAAPGGAERIEALRTGALSVLRRLGG